MRTRHATGLPGRAAGTTVLLAALVCAAAVGEAPDLPGYTTTTTTFTKTMSVGMPDPGTVIAPLPVSGVDTYLWDVDLTVHVAHPSCGQLLITLESPEGTVVTISTNNGGGNDNVFNGTLWDDSAGDPATDHAYSNNVVATPLTPEEAMGAFLWEDPNGDWKLSVTDDTSGESGTLGQWSLDITTLPGPPPIVSVSLPGAGASILDISTVSVPLAVTNVLGPVVDVDLTTFITHAFCADLDVTLTSPAATVVTLTTDNGGSNDNVFNGTLWDDDAGDPATDHAYSNNVVATPLVVEGAMAALLGEDPDGEWTLTIADDAGGDTGQLVSWTLDLQIVNELPTAVDDSTAAHEDAVLDVAAPGVLGNDTDIEGDPMTVSAFDPSSAMGATVTVNSDGSYTYDPTGASAVQAVAAGASAVDTFTYTAVDPYGRTDSATVNVTVQGAPEIFTLTTAVSGNGVVYPPAGPHQRLEGANVYVFAAPENGWQFNGWQGDASGTTIPVTVVMDRDKSVTAAFQEASGGGDTTGGDTTGGDTTGADGGSQFACPAGAATPERPRPGSDVLVLALSAAAVWLAGCLRRVQRNP